jgi:hypothetical protein
MNQDFGKYSYIDMPYLLAGVRGLVGLRESTSEDLFITDSINLCLTQHLRNFGNQTYVVTQIPIEYDGTPKAKLPKGFIRFVQENPIIYVNAAGQSTAGVSSQSVTNTYTDDSGDYLGSITVGSGIINSTMYAPQFVNNTFFKDSPFSSNVIIGGTVTENNGYLYFSSNVIAEYVKIAYLGVNFGDNGNVLIPNYFESALTNFAAYQWCQQQYLITGESKFVNSAQMFKSSFIAGRNKAKAFAVMPSSMEYKLINMTMASLL